jgi:Carboxypeptidase C (cathepsin A)
MKNHFAPVIAALVLMAAGLPASAASPAGKSSDKPTDHPHKLKSVSRTSEGQVTVEGQTIAYRAVAGTLLLRPRDLGETHGDKKNADQPRASLFYVAYFKRGKHDDRRPITFLYNGGPGSSSMWLHMGAFGPRRVVTSDHEHTPPAPYRLVDNPYSLLDASDLVFVDAPGTGFSRIRGKDAAKAFYGVDEDAHAFAAFVQKFLSHYQRWNSPKYLFGESYGTTRSAVLAAKLEMDDNIDLNGIILLSQILSFDNDIDGPHLNPGVDQGYVLALPTYAATAWYHKKLENPPADLPGLLSRVEGFAQGEYAQALAEGSLLSPDREKAVAEKLHRYTGLPTAYWIKADLRVDGGQFEHELLNKNDQTTGRLDTRFAGPSMDPLGESSEYDPQAAAIASAYVSSFNDYVRRTLHFGEHRHYIPLSGTIWKKWQWKHKAPGASFALPGAINVMPDLAAAMKYDPDLKILLNAGYYDLATPFFAALYEMHHLPIPRRLQDNIQYAFYDSGHMVYAHRKSLKALHDNVAHFIESTDGSQRAAKPS